MGSDAAALFPFSTSTTATSPRLCGATAVSHRRSGHPHLSNSPLAFPFPLHRIVDIPGRKGNSDSLRCRCRCRCRCGR